MAYVLVADDSRQFAEVLRATLEDAGYDVLTAYSGLAAVAAIENHDVELAVLDVLMPGMSGDAVAERLQLISPGLPVVLMTGGDESFAAASGLPVLRKPFPHDELLARVRRLLGR
ncbi:MAG: two-component system, OmpR family, response regulator MprA [Gaiellaceae bacterium]|jgi:two-component system OmpR family response regulator|nr:two-component system, OmpR family, response regulator MprA [Gaiellaceae bacterium]